MDKIKKKRIFILGFILTIIILTIISFYFDAQIVSSVSKIRSSVLDNFFIGITFISLELIIFLLLTFLFLLHKKKRKHLLPLWIGLALVSLINFILKLLIQRQRPYQLDIVSIVPILEKASHLTWNSSMPSFHAMLVFYALPILEKEFPKARYFWIVFAFLVAFSRVYFGLHFLSDIIVGAVLGYLIGYLVAKRMKLLK
ncbi:MAG TPA: phosphatase PAP2 family protein [Candidatus Nanoarchaeia archaeon]|nr:phosphatase PAP2 family protein [Candidatus Nanoarchaeia archaeon]